MPLFDQIVGALNNPEQEASTGQLSTILNTVQQLSGGQSGNNQQVMMSIVGNYVRSSLRQKRASGGESQVDALLKQFAGTGANPAAVSALFSPDQQQHLSQDVAQRTGMNAGQVQGMLATLVPVVLNFLAAGQQQNTASAVGGNSVLNAFMDSDGDGDVDLGDAMSMASRYLSQR
ncbi:MAG: hypothetical protein AAFY26_07815 [Cyanobacteria bacterium J06638_22]